MASEDKTTVKYGSFGQEELASDPETETEHQKYATMTTTETIEIMDLNKSNYKQIQYKLKTRGWGKYWKEVIVGVILLICLVVACMALGQSVYQNHTLSQEIEQLRAQLDGQPISPAAQRQQAISKADITRLLSRVQDLENGAALHRNRSYGTTFIRWGKQTCANATELVYSGFGAGSANNNDILTGGGVNYLCMTTEPEYNKYDLSNDTLAFSWVYAAAYTTYDFRIFEDSMHGANVACSVCRAPRTSQVTIPGKRNCPDDWTKEYEGYIMSSRGSKTKSDYICVDENPEAIEHVNSTGASLLYFASGFCDHRGGTLGHCPPYVNARELTCVLCTK